MTADQQRRRELGLIHMAKAHLGLSQEDYEYVLRQVTRTDKTSAADLTPQERDRVLKHFKAQGFTVRPKPGRQQPLREPQHRKLRAMWYALADGGAVDRPANVMACEAAIEAWAKRQLAGSKVGQLDALRFASGQQLDALIEAMKLWGDRVKAEIIR